MTKILDRYFSFYGRLARLPFFIRGIYQSIAGFVIFIASVPLFTSGSRVLWWVALAGVVLLAAAIFVSSMSLIVRRLHDIGLSGYHAIWVAIAEAVCTAMSISPGELIILGLPFLAISLWLLFYPGNAGANRFGD